MEDNIIVVKEVVGV